MNHMLQQQVSKLENLNSMLIYTNDCLEKEMELWERKEFETVKKQYIEEIEFLEKHIELCKSL